MMTKKARTPILVLALLTTLPLAAQGQTTVTQTVTYEVQAINEIGLNTPLTLVINAATAGVLPDDATDDTTTYSITTNETGNKITARIDTAMPAGLVLKVRLDPPAQTGASTGEVTLTTTPQDVVTGIGPVTASKIKILYTLSATAAVAPISGQRSVTFTLMDE
ncbi:MAG: hypothetical protein H5T90_11175 [Acetomicrobium sp.]|nr:hypothetical protein [Acetomicrobium sp.]